MNTFNRRGVASVAALLLGGALLAGCGADGEEKASNGDNSAVRVGLLPASMSSVMFKVAVDSGAFEDQGLDVELVNVTSGPAALSAIVSGDLDVGATATPVALGALAQGADVRVLDGYAQVNDMEVWVRSDEAADAEAPFPANVQGLKGLRIGVPALGGVTQTFLEAALMDAGLEKDAVTFIAVGASGRVALKNDKVDGLVGTPSYLAQFEAEGIDAVKVLSGLDPTSAGDDASGGLLSLSLTSEGFLEDQAKQVDAYCEAMREAIDWANDEANHDALMKIIGDWLAVTPEAAAPVWEISKASYLPALDEAEWSSLPPWIAGGASLPDYAASVTHCGN